VAEILLRDGRNLAFCEYGAPRGATVFWFPGTPSSRLFIPPDTQALERRGLRLVVVERPGYGVSDPLPTRTLLDWPDDVAQLADAIDVERFAVVGFSGGGPYAAACACALADRVRRLVVIGAVAPFDKPGVRASLPLRARPFLAMAARAPHLLERGLRIRPPSGSALQRAMVAHLAPCDQRVLARDGVLDRQITLTEEALRQGYNAWVRELHLATQPWGFRLEDIRVPTELLWGAEDRTTSLAMAHAWARIPGARLHVVEGEGHFVHVARWNDVLDALE
jgi:pimeloyl-ACP methyl ester carboxylesterase